MLKLQTRNLVNILLIRAQVMLFKFDDGIIMIMGFIV